MFFVRVELRWQSIDRLGTLARESRPSIVMKHYFQPGREGFRRTLAKRMPALLVGTEAKVEELGWPEVRTKLAAMNAENWATVRDELLARIAANKEVVVVEAEAIPA